MFGRGKSNEGIVDYTKTRDFYVYPVTVTFTAANQILTTSVKIQADSAFLWMLFTGSNTDTTNPQVNGGSLIQITDQGGQRLLFDAPVPFSEVAGTAQRPYILPSPHTFARNGTITLAVTNQGIAAQVVRLSFHGLKLFGIN